MQITALNSTDVRIIFRVAFTLLFVFINIIGPYCQKLTIKLTLLSKSRVPVATASGWLQGASLLQPLRYLHRIANPLWWFTMTIIALLALATDLATSAIRLEQIHTYCDFGQGMVLNLSGIDDFGIPPWNGRSNTVAGNAQFFSSNNSCSIGVYRKANNDPRFCATTSDILGSWSCQDVQDDVTYKYGGYSFYDAATDLANRGLQYSNWSLARTSDDTGMVWDHMVVLSSSQTDDAEQLFDVKASVDTSATQQSDQVMKSFQCTLNAQEANAIASRIPSATTLQSWGLYFQRQLYYGAGAPSVDDIAMTLEWLLNNMIMVAGSSNYLLSVPPPGESTQQGCLDYVTYIPNWLLALLGLTALILVVLVLMMIVLSIRLRLHRQRSPVEYTPVDQWEWMAHACAESNAAGEEGPKHAVKPKQLGDYELVVGNGDVARIQRVAEEFRTLTGDRENAGI